MNIILIGMPGSGKTTVGRALAARLSLEFLCSDEYIEKTMSIPEIFERYGEPRFRELERNALAEVLKAENAVISTGGGAVLYEENRRLIFSRGTVVWLKRELSELSREGRPLSQSMDALKKMYAVRRPIYEALADIKITVRGSVETVVEEIVLACMP